MSTNVFGKDLAVKLTEALSDYYKETNQNLEDVTDEVAEDFKREISSYTNSKGWKKYSQNFTIRKYGFVKYVGNSLKAGTSGIPLSNILENGATRKNRGVVEAKPHFKIVFDKMQSEMLNKIERKIGGD